MLSKRLAKIAPMFAGAVVAGLSAQGALATLTVDLRVTSATGGTVSADSKSVLSALPGSTVTMAVWAQVTGSNPAKSQVLQELSGSFLSDQGGVLGNLRADHIAAQFTANSASLGLVQDLDGDTDMDIGINTTHEDADSFFRARSSKMVGPRTPDNLGDADDVTFGDEFLAHAITNGTEYRIAIIEFVLNADASIGSMTHISFRPWNVAEGAVWYENSDEGGTSPNFTYPTNGQTKNPSVGVFSSGASVLITSGVPEPISLGLIALGSLGLVSRVRKG